MKIDSKILKKELTELKQVAHTASTLAFNLGIMVSIEKVEMMEKINSLRDKK